MEESRNLNQLNTIRGRLKNTNDNLNNKSVALKRQRGNSRREWRDGHSRKRKKRKKLLGEKIADWIRGFLAFLFSNVGIVCLVIGYTIAGAFIFETIEGTYSRKVGNGYDVPLSRNETAILLWDLTYKVNIFSEELWKSKVNDILSGYQKKLVNAVEKGWDGTDSTDNRQWTFAGAFLYSLTVITTIGYGNSTPKTMWGKIITIGYAIAGMPLFLLYLSNIGDILARSFKWTYARCCLCRCRKRPRVPRDPRSSVREPKKNTWQMVKLQSGRLDTVSIDGEIESMSKSTGSDEDNDDESEDDDDDDDESGRYDPQRITVPLTLCLGIMVGYVCGGALLFSKWEDWDFLDGSYFCFVSLSTIGFGDIVPGDKIYSGQGIELSFIFCSMYLMLGMALIAMCFNLMQEEVMAKMRSFTRSVKHVLRCDR